MAIYLLIKCCDGSSTDSINSVESLYGTYTATTNGGTKVKVVLRSDSKNEWKKYGTDYSDNLTTRSISYDNRGNEKRGWKPIESQGIEWSWDLHKGYIKVYYNGTMYRYERPQSGRDRELTQFGVEVLVSNDPLTDAEVISLAVNLYKI